MTRARRIAVIGPSSRGRGGIAGVIAQTERITLPSDDLRMTSVASFRGGNMLGKALSWIAGLVRFTTISVPQRPALAYVHISVGASTLRKTTFIAVARALRVPVLLHIHSAGFFAQLDRQGPVGVAARWCVRRATAVVVLSDVFAEPVRILSPKAPVHVVANAPDVDESVSIETSDRVPGRVLCVGAFVPDKGVDVLIDALALIAPQTPALHLALAGAGADESRLREQIAAAGLDGRVEFLGWLQGAAKEAEYARASLFVLPSRTEGAPLALLEAMWYGLPSVASAVGAVPEILAGDAGILVAPEDARGLADALQQLLQDPVAATALGDSASRRVRASYSPRRQRREIQALLVTYAGTPATTAPSSEQTSENGIPGKVKA